MSFINNYCGELRITKNKIYDGSRLVAVYKNNEITLIGDDCYIFLLLTNFTVHCPNASYTKASTPKSSNLNVIKSII